MRKLHLEEKSCIMKYTNICTQLKKSDVVSNGRHLNEYMLRHLPSTILHSFSFVF